MLSNNSCLNCSTITGYVYDSTTGNCKDYCGDGIRITDLCDDGNNMNGDGCSSTCQIESGWRCPNNLCSLSVTPVLTLVSIDSFPRNHSIAMVVNLNIGLRLVEANFILKFSTITKFQYKVKAINSLWTAYQMIINYAESPQN